MKGHAKGSKQYDLHQYAKATLGSGDMRAAVSLPEGEDENEWLAVHSTCRPFAWTHTHTQHTHTHTPPTPPTRCSGRLLQRGVAAVRHGV